MNNVPDSLKIQEEALVTYIRILNPFFTIVVMHTVFYSKEVSRTEIVR